MNSSRITGIALGAACMLYLLSPAPVVKHYKAKRQIPPAAVRAFYSPLGWVVNSVPPIQKAYEFYFRIWDLD